MSNILDIDDRSADYELIYDQAFRAELGIRAISFMYDDHSNDKNSYENILKLKDNIYYRLFSATHQYLVLLRELNSSEEYLQQLYKENPNYINAFSLNNPYLDRVELEVSSIFDSIIFHISSVFDYLSHIVCYINYTNKSKTDYWTKLAKTARGTNNELSNLEIRKIIDLIDRRFVGHLYDYRSRLLHNKRDQHNSSFHASLPDFKFKILITPSEIALKHFKLINEDTNNQKITLTYLASWLIKRTFIEIEEILDGLSVELKKNSHFHMNLRKPKRPNGLLLASINPENNFIEPSSEGFWREYKKKRLLS